MTTAQKSLEKSWGDNLVKEMKKQERIIKTVPTWEGYPLNQWTEGSNAALKCVKGWRKSRGSAEKNAFELVVHHKCLKGVKKVNSPGYSALREKWERLAFIVLSWVTILILSLIAVTELEKDLLQAWDFSAYHKDEAWIWNWPCYRLHTPEPLS